MQVIANKGKDKINIGLNLKYDSKQRKVIGYSRKNGNQWEFSSKAITLIQEYISKFPEVFSAQERINKNDMFLDTDIFRPEEALEKFGQLKGWLKSVGTKEFISVPLESNAIDKYVVKLIEDAIDQAYSIQGDTPKFVATNVKGVPRQAVLKPIHAPHRLANQTFELGDRVVHTIDSGIVPLAAKGTVISVDGNFADILFDRTFMGGASLGERYSIIF
jgi:5'-3' exoribonuclease 1